MQATNKIIARAIAFARVAANESASETERATATAKLTEYCTAQNLNVADIIARAAAPDTGETPLNAQARASRARNAATKAANERTAKARGEKPKADAKPKAEKPAKPSKPSEADAKRAADYAERVKLIGELRANVSRLYNGPSLAVRSNPKRIAASVYAELLAAPKHRTTLAKISPRDESALALIITRGGKAGAFDPVALNLDSGIFSRLASVGFIARDGDGFTLTADAITHAKSAAKRAA